MGDHKFTVHHKKDAPPEGIKREPPWKENLHMAGIIIGVFIIIILLSMCGDADNWILWNPPM